MNTQKRFEIKKRPETYGTKMYIGWRIAEYTFRNNRWSLTSWVRTFDTPAQAQAWLDLYANIETILQNNDAAFNALYLDKIEENKMLGPTATNYLRSTYCPA